MSVYQILSMGYSAQYNRTVSRVSVVDEGGSEYWQLIPTGSGKSFRLARDRAIDAIVDAMEWGVAPGEVKPA